MKKILRVSVAIVVIALFVYAGLFISSQNRMKTYSTYCTDKIRHELGEYLENVHMNDSFCSEGTCIYMGGVSYEGVDYSYSCKVYNKENVELNLEPLYPEEVIIEESVEKNENNELEINKPEIEEAPADGDMPVAKMRVAEGQTEEETQSIVEKTCSNIGGDWMDGSCVLEDGSTINF